MSLRKLHWIYKQVLKKEKYIIQHDIQFRLEGLLQKPTNKNNRMILSKPKALQGHQDGASQWRMPMLMLFHKQNAGMLKLTEA